jgi:hypothetical protein
VHSGQYISLRYTVAVICLGELFRLVGEVQDEDAGTHTDQLAGLLGDLVRRLQSRFNGANYLRLRQRDFLLHV